jgi:hypothetical protein
MGAPGTAAIRTDCLSKSGSYPITTHLSVSPRLVPEWSCGCISANLPKHQTC